MLQKAGFQNTQVQDIDIFWPLRGVETAFVFTTKGAVWTRLIYERQSAEVQAKIHETMVAKVAPYIEAGKVGIPCPAVLVPAKKGK